MSSTREPYWWRAFPELSVGMYAYDEQLIDFYFRANSVLTEGGTVVDLGAGSGNFTRDVKNDLLRRLMTFETRKARVIGVDVDDAVLGNPFVDESHIWDVDREIDVESDSVDLVISHWVLEHVANCEDFAREVHRILRPGGWFAARTVNAQSYVGLNRFVKNGALRDFLYSRLAAINSESEKFPVEYKINRPDAVKRTFDGGRFDTHVFVRRSAQRYGMTGGPAAYHAFRLLNKLPVISKTDLLVFAQKR